MAARTPVLDKTDLFGTLPPELLEQLRGRTALSRATAGATRSSKRATRPRTSTWCSRAGSRSWPRPPTAASRCSPCSAPARCSARCRCSTAACARPTPVRSPPCTSSRSSSTTCATCSIRRPEVLWAVVRILARRLRATDEALADAMFLDVTGRTAKRLLELADGEDDFRMPLTQEELAGMVGASRERVNKAIALFVKLGWLEISGRSRYRIVNREELEIRATSLIDASAASSTGYSADPRRALRSQARARRRRRGGRRARGRARSRARRLRPRRSRSRSRPLHAARSASMSAAGVHGSADPKIRERRAISAATASGSIRWPGPFQASGVRIIP